MGAEPTLAVGGFVIAPPGHRGCELVSFDHVGEDQDAWNTSRDPDYAVYISWERLDDAIHGRNGWAYRPPEPR